MTYSQITAVNLLNKGSLKRIFPHPQDHHPKRRMSKSNAGHHQTEKKQLQLLAPRCATINKQLIVYLIS